MDVNVRSICDVNGVRGSEGAVGCGVGVMGAGADSTTTGDTGGELGMGELECVDAMRKRRNAKVGIDTPVNP